VSSPKMFRSSKDGELGTLVIRDGKEFIRLNRPNEEVLRPYLNGIEWIPDVERRPISKAQLASICFEADLQLCKVLGIMPKKKNWLDLTDGERITWMEKGPVKDPERAVVWKALMTVLEPLTR
jgi:hypothetical protein